MAVESLELQVRVYELDYQGIVNNSVYLNYLEYARGVYKVLENISATDLQAQGISWVVSEVKLKYWASLKANDTFIIETEAFKKGRMRVVFKQKIVRKIDRTLILEALVVTACMANGKAMPFPVFIRDSIPEEKD